MARGWESKSVELQMEDREKIAFPPGNTHANADEERRLGVLELTRKRLLHEIEGASGDRFREMKRRALEHVESEIAARLAG